MVGRIDRKRPSEKTPSKVGGHKAAPKVTPTAKGGGEGPVDRFGGVGRLVGGPSDIISSKGPGSRITAPLTPWERWDIDHDPMIKEARERIAAYKNLPEPWKKEVDKWGKRTSKDMAFAISKAIMKG